MSRIVRTVAVVAALALAALITPPAAGAADTAGGIGCCIQINSIGLGLPR